jgi:hypothetical protein
VLDPGAGEGTMETGEAIGAAVPFAVAGATVGVPVPDGKDAGGVVPLIGAETGAAVVFDR